MSSPHRTASLHGEASCVMHVLLLQLGPDCVMAGGFWGALGLVLDERISRVFFSVQVTTCAARCHRAEPGELQGYCGVRETQGGPDDGQNLRGLRAAGAAAPLPPRAPPGPERHRLRGAARLPPPVLLHPRAARARGRARGGRPRFPGDVPLPQEEASEEEDPARAGRIRARQSQPRARPRGGRRRGEAVRHRPTGEARGAALVPGRRGWGRRGAGSARGGSSGLLTRGETVERPGAAIRHKEPSQTYPPLKNPLTDLPPLKEPPHRPTPP